MTDPNHDLSLRSGERQFAKSLNEIRGDHRRRYEFGISRLSPPGFGLDLFCGNGYGSYMAAAQNLELLAIDASEEAIALASDAYACPGVFHCCKMWPFKLPEACFDFAFCFESVEHVEDGPEFVRAVSRSLKPGGHLFLSTPNEELMPFRPAQHKFHVRHYTLDQTFDLVRQVGMSVETWGGQTVYDIHQDGTHSLVNPDADIHLETPGQFIILHSRK